MTPAAEFNIWADPEAAQQVFHAGVPVTMIGLDVTHKALLTPDWSERFRGAGRLGVFVAELVDFFQQYHARTYGWDGAPIHDALALAQVIQPGLVETEHRNVEVELESELTRGRTVVDLWRRTDRAPNADVGVDVDRRRIPRAPARADRSARVDAAGPRPGRDRGPRSDGVGRRRRDRLPRARRRHPLRARRGRPPRLEHQAAVGGRVAPARTAITAESAATTPREARSPIASARKPIAGGPTRNASSRPSRRPRCPLPGRPCAGPRP